MCSGGSLRRGSRRGSHDVPAARCPLPALPTRAAAHRACLPALRAVNPHAPPSTPLARALQDTLIRLQEERARTGAAVGLDVYTGKPTLPEMAGVWDAHRVKRSIITLGTVLASQLLLVDEVLRAGRGTRGAPGGA